MKDEAINLAVGISKATLDPKELLSHGGHLVKGFLNKTLAKNFFESVNKLKNDGKIKEEYLKNETVQDGVIAIAQCLEGDESVQLKKFRVIQNIFINAATANDVTGKATLYIETANKLSLEELIFLGITYQIRSTGSFHRWNNLYTAETYLNNALGSVCNNSNSITTIAHAQLIYNSLKEKLLVLDKESPKAFTDDQNFILSDYGFDLCKYIEGDLEKTSE